MNLVRDFFFSIKYSLHRMEVNSVYKMTRNYGQSGGKETLQDKAESCDFRTFQHVLAHFLCNGHLTVFKSKISQLYSFPSTSPSLLQ